MKTLRDTGIGGFTFLFRLFLQEPQQVLTGKIRENIEKTYPVNSAGWRCRATDTTKINPDASSLASLENKSLNQRRKDLKKKPKLSPKRAGENQL